MKYSFLEKIAGKFSKIKRLTKSKSGVGNILINPEVSAENESPTNTDEMIANQVPATEEVKNDGQSHMVTPRWHQSTKRTVIIMMTVLFIICLYFLRNMIKPLTFAALLIYFARQTVAFLKEKCHFSHKWAVITFFGLLLLIIIGLFTWSGISILTELNNFVNLLYNSMDQFPQIIIDWVGGSESEVGTYIQEWFSSNMLGTQLSESIRTVLKRLGTGSISFAQNMSSKVTWFFFVYMFSFFIVWETNADETSDFNLKIPGYEYDISMARYRLSNIWGGFMIGRANLIIITFVVYTILFWILQVNYAVVLAMAAALTQLIPYVGTFIAWTAVGLVSLFQEHTIFGLQPLPYAVLTVAIAFLIDKFMDGFVQPKFLAETLKVHPAIVLAATMVLARIMGVLGIFLAAPIVATIQLALGYIMKKLSDQDPWENLQIVEPKTLSGYLSEIKEQNSDDIERWRRHYHQAIEVAARKMRSIKNKIIKIKESSDESKRY